VNVRRKNMKFLKRLAGTEREQKVSAHITRLLTPLFLAIIAFGVIGMVGFSQNTAHAATTKTSACGDVVRDSEAMISYFGNNLGTVQLIKNTCTGLFYGKVICSVSGSVTLSLAAVQVPYTSYNTVNATCSQSGQIIKTAPHAYVQSQDFFAAVADIFIPSDGDGGSGVAITTQP
jgi:hypothetical protein